MSETRTSTHHHHHHERAWLGIGQTQKGNTELIDFQLCQCCSTAAAQHNAQEMMMMFSDGMDFYYLVVPVLKASISVRSLNGQISSGSSSQYFWIYSFKFNYRVATYSAIYARPPHGANAFDTSKRARGTRLRNLGHPRSTWPRSNPTGIDRKKRRNQRSISVLTPPTAPPRSPGSLLEGYHLANILMVQSKPAAACGST